jgi:hypothetical protein
MADTTHKRQAASDAPPPDLSRQRDELLRSLTKGSQLTRDFFQAYDDLQQMVLHLQGENARLRATLEADDAIKKLILKIEALEQEKEALLSKVTRVEAAAALSPAIDEMEAELANFANLNVAANCLHSTLSPRGVARRLKEILEQLVGVEAYVVYLRTEPEGLVPVSSEGLHEGEKPEDSPTARINEVVSSGVSSILDDMDPSQGTVGNPPVLIPLSIDDTVVGVLSIVRSLAHKTQLTTVDFELFKLLGLHAAAALMAAGLFARAGRVLPRADAFRSLQQH